MTTTTNEIINEATNDQVKETPSKYENIDCINEIFDKVEEDRKQAEDNRQKEAMDLAEEAEKRRLDIVADIRKRERRKRKNIAKNMTFIVCLLSAVLGTAGIGVLLYFLWNTAEWIFTLAMVGIGMINTCLHTYLYRYIREEIYHK